jgi:hypothetical protein
MTKDNFFTVKESSLIEKNCGANDTNSDRYEG